jgi:hypothetical protein
MIIGSSVVTIVHDGMSMMEDPPDGQVRYKVACEIASEIV